MFTAAGGVDGDVVSSVEESARRLVLVLVLVGEGEDVKVGAGETVEFDVLLDVFAAAGIIEESVVNFVEEAARGLAGAF